MNTKDTQEGSKLRICRTNLSPYLSSDFIAKEKLHLETLDDVKYTSSESEEEIAKADILITNTHSNPQKWLELGLLDRTQLIIHPNSGYDNFSTLFIQKTDIPIVLGNHIRAEAVAEYSLHCTLEGLFKSPFRRTWLPNRKWGRELWQNKKVFILGAGSVSQALQKSLEELGFQVSCEDPFASLDPRFPPQESDVIILACALNETTQNIINEKALVSLKEEAILINPARGKLIDLEALTQHMKDHPNFKAYLDVFPREPYPLENIIELPNLNCSCHVAGVFKGLEETMINYEKDVILSFMRGTLKRHGAFPLLQERLLDKDREILNPFTREKQIVSQGTLL